MQVKKKGDKFSNTDKVSQTTKYNKQVWFILCEMQCHFCYDGMKQQNQLPCV